MALGKFGGEFAQGTQTYVGSSNLVYFREPTLRTQLHMSVCGPERRLLRDSNTSEIGGKPEVPGAHSKRH